MQICPRPLASVLLLIDWSPLASRHWCIRAINFIEAMPRLFASHRCKSISLRKQMSARIIRGGEKIRWVVKKFFSINVLQTSLDSGYRRGQTCARRYLFLFAFLNWVTSISARRVARRGSFWTGSELLLWRTRRTLLCLWWLRGIQPWSITCEKRIKECG